MASRHIYNVRYRLDEARIYDETPFPVGTTTATNAGNEAANISVTMTYEDMETYTFNNSSSSGTGGVPTTLRAAIPVIVGNCIQIGHVENISPFEWGKTTTKVLSYQVAGSITVPPNSVATISYVGTKGNCDVPFFYTQQDTSASGAVVVTEKSDGIFKGSNSYNFGFNVDNVVARSDST